MHTFPSVPIGKDAHCATDVQKLCSNVSVANNFAIIDCLQSDNEVSLFRVLADSANILVLRCVILHPLFSTTKVN